MEGIAVQDTYNNDDDGLREHDHDHDARYAPDHLCQLPQTNKGCQRCQRGCSRVMVCGAPMPSGHVWRCKPDEALSLASNKHRAVKSSCETFQEPVFEAWFASIRRTLYHRRLQDELMIDDSVLNNPV